MAITLHIFGDLIDQRYTMNGWCWSCRTHRQVDLEAAAARLGWDRTFVGGLPLRCQRCGPRDVLTQISPPGPGA